MEQSTQGRKQNRKKIRFSTFVPYLFVMPFFLAFAFFTLYPTISGLQLSFYQWGGYDQKVFIGLDNYANALNNTNFWKALSNSMLFMITGPITTIIALLVAVLLNQKKGPLASAYKVIYFMPYIAMPVAISILFKLILNDQGILNSILLNMSIIESPIKWLHLKRFVLFDINLVLLWKYMGYHMIIYLGGLQSIDVSLYEAAKIDGARSHQIFFKIIMPLMTPFIVFMTLTIITGSLGLFDEPMMLYAPIVGGPEGKAMTLGMYIYDTIFGGNPRWGYGTAVATLMFFICIVLSLIVYKIKQRVEK